MSCFWYIYIYIYIIYIHIYNICIYIYTYIYIYIYIYWHLCTWHIYTGILWILLCIMECYYYITDIIFQVFHEGKVKNFWTLEYDGTHLQIYHFSDGISSWSFFISEVHFYNIDLFVCCLFLEIWLQNLCSNSSAVLK